MILYYTEHEIYPVQGRCPADESCIQWLEGVCRASSETTVEGIVCVPLYEEMVQLVERCICQNVAANPIR